MPELPPDSEDDLGAAEDLQTLTESDQTGSDADQTAAEEDQAASETDQAASDEDQAASDRDLEDGGSVAVHDASAESRGRGTIRRLRGGHLRAGGAAARDSVADARDRAAEARDLAAAERDRRLEELDAELDADVPAVPGPGDRAGARRARIAADRQQAAQARRRAAVDRAQAAEDRRHAAKYRIESQEERAALTAEERATMELHTSNGYEILADSKSELLRLAATIALTHHERYDGSGYPNGLVGKEIPLEGRITAVADVFDALLSDRVYRPAFSIPDAVALLEEGRASHFDPEVLGALLDNLDAALELTGTMDPEAPQA